MVLKPKVLRFQLLPIVQIRHFLWEEENLGIYVHKFGLFWIDLQSSVLGKIVLHLSPLIVTP